MKGRRSRRTAQLCRAIVFGSSHVVQAPTRGRDGLTSMVFWGRLGGWKEKMPKLLEEAWQAFFKQLKEHQHQYCCKSGDLVSSQQTFFGRPQACGRLAGLARCFPETHSCSFRTDAAELCCVSPELCSRKRGNARHKPRSTCGPDDIQRFSMINHDSPFSIGSRELWSCWLLYACICWSWFLVPVSRCRTRQRPRRSSGVPIHAVRGVQAVFEATDASFALKDVTTVVHLFLCLFGSPQVNIVVAFVVFHYPLSTCRHFETSLPLPALCAEDRRCSAKL